MFKLIELLLLLVCVGHLVRADKNEDLFSCEKSKDTPRDPWINNLKDGQMFSMNIEVVDLTSKTISLLDESYSFKSKTGEYKFQHRPVGEEVRIDYAKYFEDFVYTYSNLTNKCSKHKPGETEVQEFLLQWLPKVVLSDGQEWYLKILGPSAMLFHMWDHWEDTHRYNFEDENNMKFTGTNFCIQNTPYMLRFVEVYETPLAKNLIKSIEILEKVPKKAEKAAKTERVGRKKVVKNDEKEYEWQLRTAFNYYHVEIKSGDQQLDNNLPLGMGCARVDSKFKAPQFHDQQSELDFQFIQNQAINYPGQTDINHFDPTYSVIEHHKLYFDDAHGLGVNFGQSPVSNETIKSVHDFTTQIVFDINLQTGSCEKRVESEDGQELSVFFDDPMSIIRNIPQVLKLADKSSFVGRFETRNIDCMVYESVFTLKVNGERQGFIVTHYYAEYNFQKESEKKLPIRVDLRQFENDQLAVQLGYYVFLINKFYPALDFGRQEIFDISNCMPNYYEYNWFLIEVACSTGEVEKLRKAQLALIEAFRKELSISALRLPKILVDFDDTTITFTSKLLEVPAIKRHFEYSYNQKLANAQVTYLSDHEENCAKSCFSKPDCVAYSFCSNMLCSQLMLDGYGSDEKMGIPDGYVQTRDDHNCNLQTRKFKLKRDDLSSRDIRSVMSELQRKVQNGDFKMNIKLPASDEEEKIDLTASSILLNVKPGSKQDRYLDGEQELNGGTSESYDQFFSAYKPDFTFDFENIRNHKLALADRHSNLGLADCELQCMNNLNCHSFSYCQNRVCVITSIDNDKSIDNSLKSGIGCSVSKKNYLANYAVHENRGIQNVAKEKKVLSNVDEENPETCARMCYTSSDYECLSFEYCDAKLKDGTKSEKVCLLHELNLQSEHEVPLEWDFSKSHCDHYTKKHSTDYMEYGLQELLKSDLVEHSQVPLERCATFCDEHELCNSFDYCFSEENVEQVRCRLHSDTYNKKNVNTSSPLCSIYEAMKPKIPVKKVILKQTTYSKGLTVLLSFVALISGSSIGVLLSFLVIRKFFRDQEDDDD